MDWTKTAFVFPGQGSQTVGMGADFAQTYPEARAVFEQADDILGLTFSKICFEGPEAELNDTANTQPALYICAIAILRALQKERPDAQPAYLAGHSLGEFTALTAAGALSFEDGLRLVRQRAELMRDAGKTSPGAMAATLGIDAATLRDVCREASEETGGTLVVANDNCPGQGVISGDQDTLAVGVEKAKAAGAKRVMKLAVSIAAHSPLMESASEALVKSLRETTFKPPTIPVIGNVSASPLNTVEAIHDELSQQLTQSVRWSESMQTMIAAGVEDFIELGPKEVLSGMLKWIDRSKGRHSINSVEKLQAFLSN